MRGTLLDQACVAVAEPEVGFCEERSRLCLFVGGAGLAPELLRCGKMRDCLVSCARRKSDGADRLSGGCQERG